MDQFDRMKEKHPDALLLFRTGSTYEIYRQDAKKVSEILGTPVSTRTVGKEKNVDVASFPHEALDHLSATACKSRNESGYMRAA